MKQKLSKWLKKSKKQPMLWKGEQKFDWNCPQKANHEDKKHWKILKELRKKK